MVDLCWKCLDVEVDKFAGCPKCRRREATRLFARRRAMENGLEKSELSENVWAVIGIKTVYATKLTYENVWTVARNSNDISATVVHGDVVNNKKKRRQETNGETVSGESQEVGNTSGVQTA